MFTEIYIEARLKDEVMADQVLEAWDAREIPLSESLELYLSNFVTLLSVIDC